MLDSLGAKRGRVAVVPGPVLNGYDHWLYLLGEWLLISVCADYVIVWQLHLFVTMQA